MQILRTKAANLMSPTAFTEKITKVLQTSFLIWIGKILKVKKEVCETELIVCGLGALVLSRLKVTQGYKATDWTKPRM